jgi:outer membrane protein
LDYKDKGNVSVKKFNHWIIASIMFLALSNSALAEANTAVIDVEKAVLTTNYAQTQERNLTSDAAYVALVNNFQQLKSDLRNLENEANNVGITWSDARRAEHASQMEIKTADYKLVASKIEAQRDAMSRRVKRHFGPLLEEVMNEIIDDRNIKILLKADGALYVAPYYNITAELTAALNSRDN